MIAAAATPRFVWYLMRGSGMVALMLLTATAVLGVLGVSRWRSPRWPAFVTAGLHRNISLLAVSFLGIHVLTAVADQWIGLSWYQAVLPFGASYRPVWVGMGALSLDLLAAVVVTSLLRKRIGHRAWRAVHWSAWMMWPLAALHAVGAGTDMGTLWGFVPWAACVGALATAAVARVRRARRGQPVPAPRSAGAQAGDRPVHTPPAGARPVGARPVGARPAGARTPTAPPGAERLVARSVLPATRSSPLA